ncbi:hypothetical protein BJX68DRAFT_238129 [Aspergillus pseudodeflectus]|uniref:Secreted protein n=1 Tax=Aspergillus pseudodeflectus TaxID=176178 RepID=A0ABR4K9S4_9EURO
MHEIDLMMLVLAVVLLLLLLPPLTGTLGTLFSVAREEFVGCCLQVISYSRSLPRTTSVSRFDGCAELSLLCRLLLEPRVFIITKDEKEGRLMEGRNGGER